MKLYEYAILLAPKTKDGDTIEEGSLVAGIETVLAKDEKQAALLAGRAIPEEFMDRLDRLEVVVRPFDRAVARSKDTTPLLAGAIQNLPVAALWQPTVGASTSYSASNLVSVSA